MKILIWLLRIALFVVLLAFAVKNDRLVAVRVFFGGEYHLPLVLVMLVTFAVGVLLGATATVARLFSLRRELRQLQEQVGNPAFPVTRLRAGREDNPETF